MVASRQTRKGTKRTVDSRSNSFGEEWQSFVEFVCKNIQISMNPPNGKIISPYAKPTSVLKRMVYEFVLHHRLKTKNNYIKTSIEVYRASREKFKKSENQRVLRGTRMSYETNPFYIVLLGLSAGVSIGNFEIRRSDVSRFAKQLSYADKHGVHPKQLIGFLLQCGSLVETCRKADNPKCHEDWYVAKR